MRGKVGGETTHHSFLGGFAFREHRQKHKEGETHVRSVFFGGMLCFCQQYIEGFYFIYSY